MCDALSRNTPRLPDGAGLLLANGMAHGRREFVEVAENFPECRYVLEALGGVWHNEGRAREQKRIAKRNRTPAWGRPSSTCFGTGRR
jgi:hypothetical protein